MIEAERSLAGETQALPVGAGVRLAEAITVEAALWAVVLLLGAVLRLAAVGGLPLDAPEAERALAAYRWVHGDGGAFGHEAVTQLLAGAAFLLFGGSDTTARLFTAFVGVGTVAALLLYRDLLGRPAALIAAALIACSPSLVFASRLVAADGPAALMALLLVWAAFRYLATGRAGFLYGAAALAAGLLQAGAGGLVHLLAIAGFIAVSWAAGGAFAGLWDRLRAQPLAAQGALGLFIALSLLFATAFLADLGRAPVPGALTDFVNAFDARGAGAPPFLVLLLYEPLVLVFGLAGVWLVLRSSGPSFLADPRRPMPAASLALGRLLAVWALVAGVAALATGHGGDGLVPVVLPLTLLAAVALGEIAGRFSWTVFGRTIQYAGAAIPVLIFAFISLTQAAAPGNAGGFLAYAAGLATVAAAAVLAFAYFFEDGRHAPGVLAIVAVGLALFSVHSLWSIAYVRAPGDLYRSTWAAPELPETAARIAGLALAPGPVAGSRVQVDPAVRYPLAWYLRDVPGVTYAAVAEKPEAPLLILPRTETERAFDGYTAEAHGLRSNAVRPRLDGLSLWRWYVARTSDQPPTVEWITLYTRK